VELRQAEVINPSRRNSYKQKSSNQATEHPGISPTRHKEVQAEGVQALEKFA